MWMAMQCADQAVTNPLSDCTPEYMDKRKFSWAIRSSNTLPELAIKICAGMWTEISSLFLTFYQRRYFSSKGSNSPFFTFTPLYESIGDVDSPPFSPFLPLINLILVHFKTGWRWLLCRHYEGCYKVLQEIFSNIKFWVLKSSAIGQLIYSVLHDYDWSARCMNINVHL